MSRQVRNLARMVAKLEGLTDGEALDLFGRLEAAMGAAERLSASRLAGTAALAKCADVDWGQVLNQPIPDGRPRPSGRRRR